jgi:hypothetical protein
VGAGGGADLLDGGDAKAVECDSIVSEEKTELGLGQELALEHVGLLPVESLERVVARRRRRLPGCYLRELIQCGCY